MVGETGSRVDANLPDEGGRAGLVTSSHRLSASLDSFNLSQARRDLGAAREALASYYDATVDPSVHADLGAISLSLDAIERALGTEGI